MPKVSVLMPVYNVAAFVDQAIVSILNQTLADLELLIMDDGSTDGTLERVHKAARADSRVRVFERPNRKVATCLNELVELANADVLARMDGDDIARPERLERQYEYLTANTDVAVLGCWVQTFGKRSEIWHFRRCDNYSRNLLFFGVTILSHPTWMLRKRLLRKHPYDDAYRTIIDREWLARVAVKEPSMRFVALPEVLLEYRIHDGSVTGQFLGRQIELTRSVVDYYLRQHHVRLSEDQLSLYLACCFNKRIDRDKVGEVGELLTWVRDAVADQLPDEHRVFREKWLQFCRTNGAISAARDFVKDDGFVFLCERDWVFSREA